LLSKNTQALIFEMDKIPQEIFSEEILKYLEIEDWTSLSLTSKGNNMVVRKNLEEYVDFLKDIYIDISKLTSCIKFYELVHFYFSSKGYDIWKDSNEKRGHDQIDNLYRIFFDNGTRDIYKLDKKSKVFFIELPNSSKKHMYGEDEVFIILNFVVYSLKQNFENKEFKDYLKEKVINGTCLEFVNICV
jgi:hypothetical protein